MALNDINTRGLIPGAYVTLIKKDSFPEASIDQSAVTDAVYASVTLLQQGVIGVIGDVSSSWTSLSALMTSTLEIPQCSFTASAIAFSDKTQYKYFFRTIPTQVIMADVMLAFAAKQGWSKVGIIYTDDPIGQQFCQHAIIQASNINMQIIRYQAISQEAPQQDAAGSLHSVTTGGARIILVAATGDALNSLMLQAAEMGYLSDDYVWLLIGDVTDQLQEATDARNANLTLPSAAATTTTTGSSNYPLAINSSTPINFNETYNGLFMFDNWLSPFGYPPFETFLDAWSRLDPNALAYSCMMVMAEGFSHTIANTTNQTLGLNQLATGDLGQYMSPPAFNVGYVGPEGPMIFDSNGDVTTAYVFILLLFFVKHCSTENPLPILYVSLPFK
ncbi:periplasmic binding protein-like I [Zychaea mexicana]|uniref:periplasmic binding protein-like I n=1 Tax=Zychaea mexicana TaxID=64656 RepID=UPI0022FF14F7|nr:periplasmic binding protein-like I [Zychaea mexicana]KAI9499195.1 periplasmic binding protein-like I [Zychaea mexicana]